MIEKNISVIIYLLDMIKQCALDDDKDGVYSHLDDLNMFISEKMGDRE